jgi:hypothetical protein
MMAPETSIGPNAPENMIDSPSKHSNANVVRMALIMSSTLAHFFFWYINRGEHIRTTQIGPTIRIEKYIGSKQEQMIPNTRKYIPMFCMLFSVFSIIT